MGSFGEYFLFYGLTEFIYAYRSGLKALSSSPFRFLYPEFGARFSPICSRRSLFQNSSSPGVWHEIRSPRPLSQNWFSYSLFPLTEEEGYFHFGDSIFFLLLSGDSLGLLYVPVPHSLLIRSQSTNICCFPFWPGFVTWGIDQDSSFNGQSLAC